MPLPLIPIAIVGLAALTARAVGKRKSSTIGVDPNNTTSNTGTMTPQRQIMYEEAMTKIDDPEKLLLCAAEFQKQGLPLQATMLRKAAKLRSLPDDVKTKREAVFRKVFELKDKSKVLQAAEAFQSEGCWASAEKIREYAQGLDS
jgi:hypothetical protein